MSSQATLPPAVVLTEIVEPKALVDSPSFAKELLSLHLKDEAKEQIRQLLQKKNAGTITTVEQTKLEEYMVAGELLDLLHANARRTLRTTDTTAP